MTDANHQRLNKRRGPAKAHPCSNCGSPADEWSHTHDTDPSNLDNYRPLCITCHRNYDKPPPKTTCSKGHDVNKWGRTTMGTCRVCDRLTKAKRQNYIVCYHCGYGNGPRSRTRCQCW